MVTPNQAENLLMPLLVRAHAMRAWPQAGFVDQAAEYLVRKLDLDRRDWGVSDRLSPKHRLELTRCKWIDDQVRSFIEAYPNALGIELGAGLSTRFQRLSASSDWPRFSWADVDAPDVIDCADLIFPATDNYRLVACDIVRDDWVKKSGWTPGQPLIVILETLPDGTSEWELRNILTPLLNALGSDEAPVHLILDYMRPALQKIGKQWGCMLYGKSPCSFADTHDLLRQLHLQGSVQDEQDLAASTQGTLVHRLLAGLYRCFTHKSFWSAVHLRLDATEPSNQPAGEGLALR